MRLESCEGHQTISNPVEKLCRTRMARPRAVGGYAVVVAIETLSAFSKTKKGWLRSVAA